MADICFLITLNNMFLGIHNENDNFQVLCNSKQCIYLLNPVIQTLQGYLSSFTNMLNMFLYLMSI